VLINEENEGKIYTLFKTDQSKSKLYE